MKRGRKQSFTHLKLPISFQGLSATWIWHRNQTPAGPAAGKCQHRYVSYLPCVSSWIAVLVKKDLI